MFCYDFMIHLRRRCPVIRVKLQSVHQDAATVDLMSNKVSSQFQAEMSLNGNDEGKEGDGGDDEQHRRMRDAHLMFRQMFVRQHWVCLFFFEASGLRKLHKIWFLSTFVAGWRWRKTSSAVVLWRLWLDDLSVQKWPLCSMICWENHH